MIFKNRTVELSDKDRIKLDRKQAQEETERHLNLIREGRKNGNSKRSKTN